MPVCPLLVCPDNLGKTLLDLDLPLLAGDPVLFGGG